MTRNQISGLVGLIIGLGLVVTSFVFSPDEFAVPWIAIALIGLGIYYLFFKKEPAGEKPDVDPADRV